jgi:alpha-galactosidase
MVRKIILSAILAILSLSTIAGADPQPKILRLEQLNLANMVQGWGTPGIQKTILDKPLTINGQVFEHGVGTHAVSRLTIDLKGAALAFRAQVGLDDEDAIGREKQGSVGFRVYVDKKKVYDSGVMKLGDGPKAVEVDLKGAKRLDLEVMDGGDTTNYDHANWADAFLVLDPNAKKTPETLPRKKLSAEILTRRLRPRRASTPPVLSEQGSIGSSPTSFPWRASAR